MNFQPPDVEEDRDAMFDAWFDQQEKNGYAVISRDEWRQKLDAAATEGYAEGRRDQLEEDKPLLAWAYGKLQHVAWTKQDDALVMDVIKLLLTGGA